MSTTKRERNLIRTRQEAQAETFKPLYSRKPRKVEPSLDDAVEEWAQDYAGEHSVFE